MTSTNLRVHAALLATALVWGLNVSAVKALTEGVDVMLVASVRTVLASIALTFLLALQARGAWRFSAHFVAIALGASALMVYGNQTLFSNAMQRTSATNAALIMALAPLISALLEATLFRRPIGARQLSGILIALAGVSVVIVRAREGAWSAAATGDALMLASVIAFAAGGATVQRLARCASPIEITWLVHVAGSCMLVVHTAWVVPEAWREVVSLTPWQWVLMLYSGVLATAVGAVAWSRGIATIGVGRTANYLSWVPLFGVGFGALLLGEQLNHWHAVGLSAVLVGTILATQGSSLTVK